MERFKDENKWLEDFGNEIDVKCPKCESKAVVKRIFENKGFYYNDMRILECKNCYFSQKGNIVKYIAYVDVYCCNNQDKLKFESQLLNDKPEKIKLKCPICLEIKEFEPKIIEIPFGFETDSSLQRERWFNTELWYQNQFDKSIFWAYNLEHINYLEKYIKANLRERNTNGSGNKTLVSRLPKFVKEAKNREKLLKIISKWTK
jgi:transcription elongation factor Elf1